MRERLQKVLSLLCVLALCAGCMAAGVLAEETQTETRVLTLQWKDDDNYDGLRPTGTLRAVLGGEGVDLSAPDWTGAVVVPVDTGDDWSIETPEGYTKGSPTTRNGITTLSFSHSSPTATLIPVSGKVRWADGNNRGNIRPGSVDLVLLADGQPCGEPLTAKESQDWTVTWKDLRKYQPNSQTEISYTVKQLQKPAGYTVSDGSSLEAVNTMETAKVKLSITLSGYPEDADLSALHLIVDGPDPSMPRDFTYGAAGGSVTFEDVLPGAYLVREDNADTLVEGYTMDTSASKVVDAKYVKPGEEETLEFNYVWRLPEPIDDVDPTYDPWSNVDSLKFTILGPDPRMPMEKTYADFSDGKLQLPDLMPGVYTVVETNAEGLVQYYYLTSDAIAATKAVVEPGKEKTAKLYNPYVPVPTPEPEAEFVDIPVTKSWNDNNNEDGNRPDSVTVRLYADGVEVDNHVLTADEGWNYTFLEKPRFQEDNKTEIAYTVNEDAVPMYAVEIRGYNLINNYKPERVSVSVVKQWRDNNNAQKLRPTSIAMSLSNGQSTVRVVILSEQNGWAATVNDLPTVVNGKKAVYTWKEQAVINYTKTGEETRGNVTTFTNSTWERPPENPPGKPPKNPGPPVYFFPEYETPLGIEIVINHVGDCFD